MTEPNKKSEAIKKGEFIIMQGREPHYIYYLTSGSLEILSAPDEYSELAPEIIASKSRRVGIINGKSLINEKRPLFDGFGL